MTAPDVVCVGLTTLDLLHTVPHHPGADEKIVAERQQFAAGGPAANAAVTAAALGSRVVLVTALGRHPLARVALDDLLAHGVEVCDADPDDGSPPAVSSVAVHPGTGQRSVISVNAGARRVAPPVTLAGLVADARAVLIDGHHPRLAAQALRAARAAGVTTLLDGGSWKPDLEEHLHLVDWAVCGARFRVPAAVTASPPPDSPPPDSAPPDSAATEAGTAEALLARGVRVVAFSHGPDPVDWWLAAPGRPAHRGRVAVPEVRAVDTLGAGDALHGAIVHELAGLGPRPDGPGQAVVGQVLARACGVAALRVSVPGPREWLASLPGPATPRRTGPGRSAPSADA